MDYTLGDKVRYSRKEDRIYIECDSVDEMEAMKAAHEEVAARANRLVDTVFQVRKHLQNPNDWSTTYLSYINSNN